MLALIPQALPLAMPIGLPLGIVLALRGQMVSRSSKQTIIAVAVLCAVVSFALTGWVMPRANQAFRTTAFQDAGNVGVPRKGNAELTLNELRRENVVASQRGELHRARSAAIALHLRWSSPRATIFTAVFALSLLNRFRASGRTRLAGIVCGVLAGYYFVAKWAEYFASRGDLPPFAAVWFPNFLLLLISGALLLTLKPSIVQASN